jgi:hopanoid biosynthesis associated RND transporter like protein HpnN
MFLSRLLAAMVEHSRRRAPLAVLVGLLLAAVSLWYASGHLGVTTDTNALFSATLPWRQREIAWDRAFPQFNDLLVAVVDAPAPEEAEATATELARVLAADPVHFTAARRPDASAYLQNNGLLFLDSKQLGPLLDATIDAQPFLGQLVADPSMRGLLAALDLVTMGVDRGQANLGPFRPALAGFHTALADAAAGHPRPLSWQNLLAGPLVAEAGPYRFVLASPKLDYGALQPGGAATRALRAAIARLPAVQAGTAHVRVTGSVALSDEEFATVAQGMAAAAIGSTLLIALWLFLAVRSWRLIVPILATLLLGLALTVGFAALAVGTLNLVSIAFAVLFVGIAVDFAIQFCVRYRESRHATPEPAAALAATAWRVGPQILVAALASAAGFLAFVPTDFVGVAELGLIAGVGMLIALLCTLLFLPAALTLLRPHGEAEEIGFALGERVEQRLQRLRRPILLGCGALALLGVLLLPRLAFDSDPLHTKNPTTEAMRTLNDLMASPLTDPYSIDMLAPTQAEADALADRLRSLPLVEQVLTLSSFVPDRQQEKLALLADTANILAPTLTAPTPAAPVTPADLRLAAQTTAQQIERVAGKLAKDDPLLAIAADLHALAAAPDATLIAANAALTRFLPPTIERLRNGLNARPSTLADVPEEIARDWRLPDGRVRVQAVGRPEARGSAGLHALVAQVRTLAPNAGGAAVTIVETARTIVGAFRNAALAALLAIAVLLALVLRRALDVALVMAPLLLSAALTVVLAVALPLPLNFANIIALPLLLGVGVSFNIYFVMNWRGGARRFLGTATARAILFSALTTGTAFGSLALSRHPGTASMGELLLLSLGCTLAATLVFVPALLGSLRSHRH